MVFSRDIGMPAISIISDSLITINSLAPSVCDLNFCTLLSILQFSSYVTICFYSAPLLHKVQPVGLAETVIFITGVFLLFEPWRQTLCCVVHYLSVTWYTCQMGGENYLNRRDTWHGWWFYCTWGEWKETVDTGVCHWPNQVDWQPTWGSNQYMGYGAPIYA